MRVGEFSRRGFIGAGLALGSVARSETTLAVTPNSALPGLPGAPDDQDYWGEVAWQFDVSREVVQLENANFGIMARPVLAAYNRHLQVVNERNSFYARRLFATDAARARARVAATLGVGEDEIAFTHGASEALAALIVGYNRLRTGDTVLCADLDRDGALNDFSALQGRRGVAVVKIDLREPATRQGLIDAYAAALAAHPRTRLVLLTHVSNRTGLVLPVTEIVALARSHGADVILDSAHAWGQVEFNLAALNADFVALTCHKWIGAPLGIGVCYIRRERSHIPLPLQSPWTLERLLSGVSGHEES